MILIYAYGSGLGHLKRVSDFLHQENYDVNNCIILTNSNYLSFWENGCQIIRKENSFFASKEEFFLFIKDLDARYEVEEIIVDVFPEGFYGELTGFLQSFEGRKKLLARILSQDYFKQNPSRSYFDLMYQMEIGVNKSCYHFTETAEYIRAAEIDVHGKPIQNESYFLVIHSQPYSEVLFLYQMAKMYQKHQKIIIQTMVEFPEAVLGDNTDVILNEKSIRNLMENAEIIFSAAGFNLTQELAPYRKKWKCIPFPRTYDDQFLRKGLNF